MKKTIIASIVGLIAAVLICAGSVWCFNGVFPWDKEAPLSEANVDSLVQMSIKEVANPTFYSVDEVMVYRDMNANQKALDSAFYALPDKIIEKVAGVLVNRDGAACKRSIILEYNANRSIFDNLPDDPVAEKPQNQSTTTEQPIASVSIVQEGSTTVTEAPPTKVVSTTVKDTTIDGKPATITTKVEKHE